MTEPLQQRIRRARERAHLSQAALAERIGVSLRTIGNWENGASVPRNRMGALEELLGERFDGPDSSVGAAVQDADPDPLPVGTGVDPELLTQLAHADPAAIEAVRAVLRAARRGD